MAKLGFVYQHVAKCSCGKFFTPYTPKQVLCDDCEEANLSKRREEINKKLSPVGKYSDRAR